MAEAAALMDIAAAIAAQKKSIAIALW